MEKLLNPTLDQIAKIGGLFAELKDDATFMHSLGNWTQAMVEDSLARDDIWVQKIEADIRVFMITKPIYDGNEILLLATAKAFQCKGYTYRFLTEWLSQLRAGYRVWLEVHEKNVAARNLYEKCGFKVTGKRPRYYSDGGNALLLDYVV